MKTIFEVLEVMLGEEQAATFLDPDNGQKHRERIAALVCVMGLLTTEEAGEMV